MKTIRIKYVDFFPIDPETFLFTKLLRRHYNVEISDDPEYLFYSLWGTGFLAKRYDRCVKICVLIEDVVPDFNLCDYAVSFEDIAYGDRHLRLPYAAWFCGDAALYDRAGRDPAAENRPRFCSFTYSHSPRMADYMRAAPMRVQLLDALNAYKPVDCGGKFRHNIDIPHVDPAGRESDPAFAALRELGLAQRHFDNFYDKIVFDRGYKFSIACENNARPGYCTEKLVNAFEAGTVPIYWGDPRVKETFNEKAFVCAADYPDLQSVVEQIKRIDTDDALYTEMLRQPVFREGWSFAGEMRRLEEFLDHIAGQPFGSALRRSNEFLGALYQDKLEEYVRVNQKWQKLERNPAVRLALRAAKLPARLKNAGRTEGEKE